MQQTLAYTVVSMRLDLDLQVGMELGLELELGQELSLRVGACQTLQHCTSACEGCHIAAVSQTAITFGIDASVRIVA